MLNITPLNQGLLMTILGGVLLALGFVVGAIDKRRRKPVIEAAKHSGVSDYELGSLEIRQAYANAQVTKFACIPGIVLIAGGTLACLFAMFR